MNDTAAEPFLEDASGYRGEVDRTFVPSTAEELQEILRAATAERIPLTIAGAGTGLTGARVPHGGWVISLRRFDELEILPGVARAGAGVLLKDVQQGASRSRQFFGPNPTESAASIGGIINTNASGSQSFLYGSVRKHILALDVAFADGTIRRFERGDKVDFPIRPIRRSRARKDSAGYCLEAPLDWIDLLSGSEGTLAIVMRADLRLLPEPPALLSAVVFFAEDEEALNAVDAWRAVKGLRILEFFDANSLAMMRPHASQVPAGAAAGLMIEQELSGRDDPEVDEWVARLREHHAYEDESWFGFAASDRERFREFRHTLPVLVLDRIRSNGYHKFGTDFAVPLEHGRALLDYYRARCDAEMPGRYVIYGHIGDANCHLNLFPENEKQAAVCWRLMEDFARFSVSLEGTVAAEHGIGKLKTGLFRLMYSPEDIEAMREVKQRLDPLGLLGQGTMFGVPTPH